MKKIPLRQVRIISWTLYALAILLILLGWLLRPLLRTRRRGCVLPTLQGAAGWVVVIENAA